MSETKTYTISLPIELVAILKAAAHERSTAYVHVTYADIIRECVMQKYALSSTFPRTSPILENNELR